MDGIAINAFLTTHLAAASAMVAWMGIESLTNKKPSAIGCASGLVAGLVAITPAAGFVGVGSSIIIGLAAGAFCCFGINFKHKLGYDDALDVVGIHGLGGILGAILTGVFADPKVNPVVSLESGRGSLILNQVIGIVAVGAFAYVASWLLAKAIDKTIGLRSTEDEENLGLDLAYHGESGYDEEVRISSILIGDEEKTPAGIK